MKWILAMSVLLCATASLAARPKKKPVAATPAPVVAPTPTAATPTAPVKLQLKAQPVAAETRCSNCHVESGWDNVKFAHDRTGFPLRGKHRHVACASCHPTNFSLGVPDQCAGCHRDVHAQEFGQECAGCHDEESWRSRFNADAHRNTNFPLNGRHAFIPCTECHRQVRDRNFSRAAVDCQTCHLADYNRTTMASSINHVTAGFSTACQTCHLPWRWAPARFPAHDNCFRTSSGVHAGLRCLQCHTTISTVVVTGACMTNNAACTTCHQHDCARTDARHVNVPGYQCKDRKCYECHRFAIPK